MWVYWLSVIQNLKIVCMQLSFEALLDLNCSHLTLSRQLPQSFLISGHFDVEICVKMTAACKQFLLALWYGA